MNKQEQKERIIKMMHDDEKSGLYEQPQPSKEVEELKQRLYIYSDDKTMFFKKVDELIEAVRKEQNDD